jgi:hypothetical protein
MKNTNFTESQISDCQIRFMAKNKTLIKLRYFYTQDILISNLL